MRGIRSSGSKKATAQRKRGKTNRLKAKLRAKNARRRARVSR